MINYEFIFSLQKNGDSWWGFVLSQKRAIPDSSPGPAPFPSGTATTRSKVARVHFFQGSRFPRDLGPLKQLWQWHPTPVLLPGKSQGRRSLVGCSPWGRWESDTTERLHFHFSLSCIGEGNGNPLQCSCLENPRDGGAWWAAIYGVAQSRTRLK